MKPHGRHGRLPFFICSNENHKKLHDNILMIKIKRIYDPPQKDDGTRILVDHLWPRGIRKEEAKIDYWAKNIAPSSELRKWFNHDPEKWQEFKRKYFIELSKEPQEIEKIKQNLKSGDIALIYSAKDELNNNAVVLKEYLERIN